MRGFKAFVGVVALGLFGVAGTSSADPLLYQGASFSFGASGSGTNWTLTFTADFSGAGFTSGTEFYGDFIEAWSLTAPGNVASASLVSLTPGGTTGWVSQGTSQANAKGCSGTANDDAVCVDFGAINHLDGGGPLASAGSIYTWVVDVIFDSPVTAWTSGNFHILTVRCDSSGNNCYKDGGLISQNVNVPEPGTLGLLGLGLAGLGFGMRRRRKI
jgi:hypothetical protein